MFLGGYSIPFFIRSALVQMSIDETAGARPRAADSELFAISGYAGPKVSTSKGGVVHCVRPPETFTLRTSEDCVVVLLAPVQGFQSRSPSGRAHVVDAPAGAVAIVPAGMERYGGWASPFESLTVSYEPGQLGVLAAQEFDLPELNLSWLGFATADEQALQIGHLLRQELLSGTPNALYVESLITALGLHVIRRYSNAGGSAHLIKPVGGLSPTAVKRVEEFLNLNLAGKVTIGDLAALCDLSRGHFTEAFTRTFGMPPHRYLLNLRLGRAVQLLSQTALPIAEIAYLSGFSSQSHLTSAMRKYRLTTPAQVRSSSRS